MELHRVDELSYACASWASTTDALEACGDDEGLHW